MAQRVLGIFFFSLLLVGAILFAQTPYYGPDRPTPASAVQVQLYVYDQTDLGSQKIETVSFNGRSIALQPPDLYGFRGGGGFQLQPGKYNLEWKISRDASAWPRSQSYQQTIAIQPGDTWVQVTIRGDKATVL